MKVTMCMMTIVIFLLSACEAPPVVEKRLRPVRFISAEFSGAEQRLSFSGTSHADLESNMSFKVSGTIAEKRIKVGDSIKKGDVLFKLDPIDYQVNVQQTEASLTSSRANERNAIAHYDRLRLLYENNNASLNNLDSAKANAESSSANVRLVLKQLESAKNQLSYTQLRAPADCDVAETSFRVNENVGIGQQVAKLNCGDGIQVTVLVPEMYITQVNVGDSVNVRFSAIDGDVFLAHITEVSVSSDTASTYPVKATLSRKEGRIRAGMAANVMFNFVNNSQEQLIYVPSHAVAEDVDGRFVYLVNNVEQGVGTIYRQAVTVGKLHSRGMQILSGVKQGDSVVTAGVSFLSHGQRVKMPLDNAKK